MPIYEYYSPDTNKLYSFYAKTLAQGKKMPKCPDGSAFRMVKVMSSFAITGRDEKKAADAPSPGADETPASPAEDARMEAAFGQLEKEMGGMDENDPRAMGRLMRRMSELTGEKLDGEADEVMRKLEEGADPDDLEEQLGQGGGSIPPSPNRDPTLYDY